MQMRLFPSWSDLPKTVFRFLLCLFVFFGSISNPSEAQKIYDDLFSVTFPNDTDGWASGRWGCILHTADGGKTWVRQNTGTDLTLSSVFFTDPKNGWAVGEEGIIIHTKDGGKTWEKQKSPVRFFHMKVFFANPLKGWIASEQTHILVTEDGGMNWKIGFKDEDLILKSISFCDPLHGWAVGEFGFIYHTRNGGKTWEKQAGEYGLSAKTGEIEGGTFLFDVKTIDPQTAWAVGIDGYVTMTHNGGKTWKEVKTGAPKTQLFCIDSNREKTILIGGFGAFLSSEDQGKTWKTPEFKPPATYDWFYGLAKRGHSGFVAVGVSGIIYINEGKNPSVWNKVVY
jgi:photosystem II stability/assembly factor-like uncharacterized protein